MNILTEQYLDLAQKQNVLKYGKQLTKEQLKEGKKAIESSLNDPTHSHSYRTVDGILQTMIRSWSAPDAFGVPTLNVEPFYLDENENFSEELQIKIKELEKQVSSDEEKLSIKLFGFQENLYDFLLKFGFEIEEFELVGETVDSLKSLKAAVKEDQGDYTVSYAKEEEIEMILEVLKRAHQQEESSLQNFETEESIEAMRGYYKQMCDDNAVHVLKKQEEIIGEISLMPKLEKKTGLIASISIDPDHQGKKLSYLLYMEALQELRRRRVPYFTGYSSTEKVLKISEKLNRKICSYKVKKKMNPSNSSN